MAVASKTALVLTPRRQCATYFLDELRRQPWLKVSETETGCACRGRGLALDLDVVHSLEEAVGLLASGYYNLVVVDCRHLPRCGATAQRQERVAFAFLDALRRTTDRERRYPFRRVVVLVGDADEARADRLVFAMGERHVGACLRDASLSARTGEAGAEKERDRFVDAFWSLCTRMLVERRRGTKAINLAGGGISGIYYELGVLKCLDDATDVDIRDFDLYFGISAGALVAAGLANGFAIDELIHKFGRIDPSWPYRLQLGWRHLNLGDVPRRLLLAQRELASYVVRMLRGQDEFSVTSVLGPWAALLGPIFDNTEFEAALGRLFGEPGHTNDFRKLPRRLFIGATDQDRREHVLFGSEGLDDVPISKAIQASAAMNPFFPSVEINGRYYADGIVTRTSNVRVAVDHGADLVFVVDPFVPLIAETPGFNTRHGNMWVMEQDYKTMSYTRYEQARNELLRRHSRVSIYTFVPSNRMRRLMSSQNPFVSRNFHPIVCEAYRSTYRRLRTLEYKIAGELASHGIQLDLAPVEEKVRALASLKKPDARVLLGAADGAQTTAA